MEWPELPDEGPPWALSAVDPARLASLADSEGTVTGTETVGRRTCVVAEVVGLRGRRAIVRMERTGDPAPLLVLDGLVEWRGDGPA